MSIISKSSFFNEEMVVLSRFEGDELLYLSRCGITDFDSNYRISRQNSTLWVIEYVCSGSGYLNIDGRVYHPKAGDVYIVKAGSNHVYGSNPDDPWRKIWFNCRGVVVDSLLKQYELSDIDYIPDCPELENIFSECLNEMKVNPDDASYHSAIVVHKLIYKISKFVHGKMALCDDVAVKLKSIIDKEALTGKNLSEIIRNFNLSESQLIRKFKETYNCTPYSYLLECRLNIAKSMLLNTAAKVSDISRYTGFSDAYYFSALFKKKFGVSPAAYRFAKKQ